MTTYKSIGTTASRIGLTEKQQSWLEKFLDNNTASVLHHGDCVGGDDTVATLFAKHGSYIIAHPGSSAQSLKACCRANDFILPPRDNLVRDRVIVNSIQVLLGFPATNFYVETSGTWYTIRYAMKQKVDLRVIGPDGNEL